MKVYLLYSKRDCYYADGSNTLLELSLDKTIINNRKKELEDIQDALIEKYMSSCDLEFEISKNIKPEQEFNKEYNKLVELLTPSEKVLLNTSMPIEHIYWIEERDLLV